LYGTIKNVDIYNLKKKFVQLFQTNGKKV